MINNKKLDLWASLGLNVLITGEYGVGKTAVVEETFKRNGLKLFDINNYKPGEQYYLYFSAGTMDPYVDLIGVPREQSKNIEGEKYTYLDLLRPLPFATDCVVGIFMDELNRADAKVRNAVMEIIQFKSINGKKFNNLKMIWAAINPEDAAHTYDVERLDPAQKDRFHIHTSIDFKPDKTYFFQKHGEEKGKSAIEWWELQKVEFQKLCSPRRLDYALSLAAQGVDLADILDKRLNVGKLASLLKNGLAREQLAKLLDANKIVEAEQLLANDNVYTEIEPWFTGNPESLKYRGQIFELLHPERTAKLLVAKQKDKKFLEPLFARFYESEKISSSINMIAKTSKDTAIQYLILDMIPTLKSDNLGSDPVIFIPTKNTTTVFSTWVENLAGKEAWMNFTTEKEGNEKRMEIIRDMQNTPRNLVEKDAAAIIKIMLGIIKHSHPSIVESNLKEVFGPLNYALKRNKKDMKADTYHKIDINKLITQKMEQYLWIPAKVS